MKFLSRRPIQSSILRATVEQVAAFMLSNNTSVSE